MKKYFAITILALFAVVQVNAQTRGVKIGFIDMEYILQNVPDYAEAKSQLEQKAQRWKQDIEAKKTDIAKLKDALKTERALLTKELIEEREQEIKFQEDELLDFQQKKFGPNGDLMTQKAVLVKPIQDQVFTIVQDIAEAKKFDFVFDKSSDLTMLFAAKRYDISDQVIRQITRAEKRQQLSGKDLKKQQAQEELEDMSDNPSLKARQEALEAKKKAREELVAQRKAAAETARLEKEKKRQELLDAKKGKKTGTVPANDKPADGTVPTTDDGAAAKTAAEEKQAERDSLAAAAADAKAEKAAARAKVLEDRKKALEEKKQKALEAREAAKKAKEEKNKTKTE